MGSTATATGTGTGTGAGMLRLGPLLWGVLAFLIATAVVRRTRTWLRLRHIPGPPTAGFSELWLLRKTFGGRCHLDTAEACTKYGSIVRIGPHQLVTNDPDVLRRMSAVRSPYTRSNWYDGIRLEADYDHVLSTRDENRHNELRAKMAAGYAGKENEHLEDSIDANIARLIRLLESKYLSTETEFKPVDFAPKAQYFTLDVISEIAFGEAFGCMAADDDVASYIKASEETIPLIVVLGIFPWLARILYSWPCRYLLPSEKDPVGMGKLMRIANAAAAERYGENKKERRDMLGSFVRHGLTQREMQSEILLQLVAGSDTSAQAMRATMLYIMTNAQVQEKLLRELSTAKISNPIKDAEARELRYLQAVIKESLRIYPPVTGLFLKEVPPGGDTLNGIFVPGGACIGSAAFGVMRNPKIWGQDADLFRPERWLEADGEILQQMELNLELNFGYGKYQCLGKNVARIELNKVFVELLRHFEFTIVNPGSPWNSVNWGLFFQKEMWMRITKREVSF